MAADIVDGRFTVGDVQFIHIHVVARKESDAAWPGPVWGFGAREPYVPRFREGMRLKLAEALGAPA